MSSEHGRYLRGLPPIGADAQDLARAESGFGRFGRMFPDLPVAVFGADGQTTFPGSTTALVALAESMIKENDLGTPINEAEEEDENPTISSGYTYFGQFIDHDLTFDTASSLDKVHDPAAIEDFRTPRFDLDSMYGRGPDDQPYMYRGPDHCALILGDDKAPTGALPPRRDLPRNAEGRAIIGDPRNDENKLVSQFHALFQAFHNIVVAKTPEGPDRFLAAQQRVRFHYQWLVVNDFLRRILDHGVWQTYFGAGLPQLRFYRRDPDVYPFIPVEFAVAAYRFGHSMIRPSYSLNNPVLADIDGKKPRIPVFAIDPNPRNHLNGFQPLPDFWGIDWSFFFDGVAASTHQVGQVVPQPSYRIDTLLVEPLKELPDRQGQQPPWRRSLAARNLVRGRALGLPSGQRVADAMGLTPLDDEALWLSAGNLDDAAAARRRKVYEDFPGFRQNAPLWYYVLREAEIQSTNGSPHGGHRLGAVGSTIVAETFAGLLLSDPFSYLSRFPGFQPDIEGADPATFTIGALINFVDQHHALANAPAPPVAAPV